MIATDPQKDIDLVIVTGAGASRSFGHGREFPLRGGWAQALLDKINKVGHGTGYRELIDLDGSMDGPTFEEHLGNFLRRAQALVAIEPFLEPSSQLLATPQQARTFVSGSQTVVNAWYQATKKRGRASDRVAERDALRVVRRSRYQRVCGSAGYGWLLNELRVAAGSTFGLRHYELRPRRRSRSRRARVPS